MPFPPRKVTASALNIRNEPSIDGLIIGEIPFESVVTVLGLDGNWLKINSGRIVGWSFYKYSEELDAPTTPRLITYNITSDLNGRLNIPAKVACNFWNHFLVPRLPIVMNLGVFTDFSTCIACSYFPKVRDGVIYGRVEFNTTHLVQYSEKKAAGTVIHEPGHTLGFGWDDWRQMFDHNSGIFRPEYISAVPTLGTMRAETTGGDGTDLSHWDEHSSYSQELLTGWKSEAEYVLPVTIDVMKLLGHQVTTHLPNKTLLATLIDELKNVQFQRMSIEPWEHFHTEGQ